MLGVRYIDVLQVTYVNKHCYTYNPRYEQREAGGIINGYEILEIKLYQVFTHITPE